MARKKKLPYPTPKHPHAQHEAEGIGAGALSGAALGAVAGPPGVVAGAIVGGMMGAAAAAAVEAASKERGAHRRELDAEIGSTEGELGAPNLEHPPARVGAYSAASAGDAGSTETPPAEGPMQPPPDDGDH